MSEILKSQHTIEESAVTVEESIQVEVLTTKIEVASAVAVEETVQTTKVEDAYKPAFPPAVIPELSHTTNTKEIVAVPVFEKKELKNSNESFKSVQPAPLKGKPEDIIAVNNSKQDSDDSDDAMSIPEINIDDSEDDE